IPVCGRRRSFGLGLVRRERLVRRRCLGDHDERREAVEEGGGHELRGDAGLGGGVPWRLLREGGGGGQEGAGGLLRLAVGDGEVEEAADGGGVLAAAPAAVGVGVGVGGAAGGVGGLLRF